jgi:hypothetical protein
VVFKIELRKSFRVDNQLFSQRDMKKGEQTGIKRERGLSTKMMVSVSVVVKCGSCVKSDERENKKGVSHSFLSGRALSGLWR